MNLLCSIAVLDELGLDLKNVKNFFKEFKFLKGRGNKKG